MENLITRYRNVTILVAVLFAQVLGLAVQVKRSTENESTRLIRIWAVGAISPFEKAIVLLQRGSTNLWHNYFYLRGVRQENRDLKEQIERLQIEQAHLRQDAEQAQRLQLLLGFKEQFISRTLAAQVIGSSGSAQSRSIYIDKGTRDGIKQDMAVITATGVVGKVLRVFKTTSQVLLINDQSSGVGAILEKSRLQGVLRGTPSGEVVLEKVMSDESVEPGERVLTSGGDQIFPKGLPVGTVTKVSPGPELFLNIRVKPSADLSRLEEVLVVTQQEERQPSVAEGTSRERAADILAQRLPSIPDKPTIDNPFAPPPPTSGLKIAPASGAPAAAEAGGVTAKPQNAVAGSKSGATQVTPNSLGEKAAKPSGATATDQPGSSVANAKPTNTSPTSKPVNSSAAPKSAATPKTTQSIPGNIPDNREGDESAAPVNTQSAAPQPAPERATPPQDRPQPQVQPQ